jgi:ribose transport system permease protein
MDKARASWDWRIPLYRFLSGYGMLAVLLLLAVYYSWVTWAEQHPTGVAAGRQLGADLVSQSQPGAQVLIIAGGSEEDSAFARALESELIRRGIKVIEVVKGEPADARAALERLAGIQATVSFIACDAVTARWSVLQNLSQFHGLGRAKVVQPRSYWWPNFLKADNLLNVANQIVVIALVAIGMTFVVIAGGIDLSVGSLIALSAVLSTQLIRHWAGAEHANAAGLVVCCLGGIALCALAGLISGLIVTQFGVPPFIVTLGMMLVGSGLAFILAGGQSIYQVPDSFVWLGRGTGWLQIPNAVWLMLLMYGLGYLLMERMALGRYIYAIGGNWNAALLSGVPVKRVIVFTYAASGALAGLGGIVTASQLKSGAPTYGTMYELYVIAAVVVGGTSLLGGEGKILGTLIGAFIIAVIQNGMNLTGVESYTQKVVLGFLILGAVLLDRLRKVGLDSLLRRGSASQRSTRPG